MTSKIRPEGYPPTPQEIAWEEAKRKATASGWGEDVDPSARLAELRKRKWEKAEAAREIAREAAYARGAAQAPSMISRVDPLVLLVVGWIVLSLVSYFVLTAAGYKEEPARRSDPPYTQTDPTHPCYGLTAQECKWN